MRSRTKATPIVPLTFAEQTEFAEPTIRINTTLAGSVALDWSERAAWDEFVRYYQSLYPAH